MKKKNEKTYAVSKDTVLFLVKMRRYMHSAWLNEDYPCYRDKEFTKIVSLAKDVL